MPKPMLPPKGAGLYWHFTDGKHLRDGTPVPKAGQTLSLPIWKGPPLLCVRGFHGSASILDAARFASHTKSKVAATKIWGGLKKDRDKVTGRHRHYLTGYKPLPPKVIHLIYKTVFNLHVATLSTSASIMDMALHTNYFTQCRSSHSEDIRAALGLLSYPPLNMYGWLREAATLREMMTSRTKKVADQMVNEIVKAYILK